jgi:septum formation protein
MKKLAASATAGTPSAAPSEPPPSYESSQQTAPATAAPQPPLPRARPPLDMPALNAVRGKRIILASASPRRRQLLAQIGLADEVEVIPSSFAEDLPKAELSPLEYCLRTATEKCMRVYEREAGNDGHERGEPALVLAADTVVVSRAGDVLEKPRSFAEHVGMLKMLRDTGTHRVFTAVACMAPLESLRDPGYALETAVEETAVLFDPNGGLVVRAAATADRRQFRTSSLWRTSRRVRVSIRLVATAYKALDRSSSSVSKDRLTTLSDCRCG